MMERQLTIAGADGGWKGPLGTRAFACIHAFDADTDGHDCANLREAFNRDRLRLIDVAFHNKPDEWDVRVHLGPFDGDRAYAQIRLGCQRLFALGAIDRPELAFPDAIAPLVASCMWINLSTRALTPEGDPGSVATGIRVFFGPDGDPGHGAMLSGQHEHSGVRLQLTFTAASEASLQLWIHPEAYAAWLLQGAGDRSMRRELEIAGELAKLSASLELLCSSKIAMREHPAWAAGQALGVELHAQQRARIEILGGGHV